LIAASGKIDTAPLPTAYLIFRMTQHNSLDQKGNFHTYPLAELFVEIGQSRLSGSLRASSAEQKSVFYFDEGEIVFAVSNAKALRLFNVMLQNRKIEKDVLTAYPNFANDMEFSTSLQNSGKFSKDGLDQMFALQIEAIIVHALSWPDGEWHFSPLARLRGDVRFEADVHRVLMDYARCVPSDVVCKRFRSVNESFCISPAGLNGHVLQAHEAYVLERFQNMSLNIAQLRGMCSLPESGMLQALYVLWLGGVLLRRNWNAAFSPVKVGEILSAKIRKVKGAQDIEVVVVPSIEEKEDAAPEPNPVTVLKAAEITLSLGEYLQQVEKAETHYDILGLPPDAEIIDIKQTYFGLAKLFHPDKYHREKAKTLKRVQAAFTSLAHAYETLKDEEARDSYNFKMRKEIEAREKRILEGGPADGRLDNKKDSALQSFEQALICLKQEDHEQAVTLLGRSVHYSPENPQFQAYYGKALSAFEGQDHKALAAFQTAVKLAPNDEKIRMMLVDFLLEIDMQKRAVGELKRFIELVPQSREAQKRLMKLSG
jgi:tetratricopeptide (TPR) repeat protein